MKYNILLIFSLSAVASEAWSHPTTKLKTYRRITQSQRTPTDVISLTTALRVSNAHVLPDIDVITKPTTSIAIPNTSTTTTAKTNDNADVDTSTYLIHKGRAVDMIKRCVSVEGLSLSKGWTPQATEAFKIAIG